MMRFFLLTLVLFTPFSGVLSWSCSSYESFAEQYKNADLAFRGTVTQIQKKANA